LCNGARSNVDQCGNRGVGAGVLYGETVEGEAGDRRVVFEEDGVDLDIRVAFDLAIVEGEGRANGSYGVATGSSMRRGCQISAAWTKAVKRARDKGLAE